MKILLLNDNPVVNKLVTLSAQKTSDELDVVDSIDALQPSEYNLLVVDDNMYNEDMFSEIKSKVTFSKSLYICARDAAEVEAFSSTLKKPFLPTDLVELFLMFAKEVNESSVTAEDMSVSIDELEEIEELEELETEETTEDLLLDDDISLDDLSLEDDNLLLDDEELDDEMSFSDEDLEDGESVLDDEEAQKVKDLLDETSDDVASETIAEYDPQFAANELGLPLEEIEEFIQDFINQAYEFKDELYSSLANNDLDNIKSLSHKLKGVAANLRMEEALEAISIVNSSTDNAEIEASADEFYKVVDKLSGVNTSDLSEDETATDLDELEEFSSEELDEELTLEDELEVTEIEDFAEELELDEPEEELDLQTQIEKAVEELSDEDLESELDEETLLEIATNDIDTLDDFDSLTSNDLKLAIGEEVNTEEPEVSSGEIDLESFEEVNTEESDMMSDAKDLESFEETEQEVQANSIEALENLLAALKDKNVAASMKGTKININITIGDE